MKTCYITFMTLLVLMLCQHSQGVSILKAHQTKIEPLTYEIVNIHDIDPSDIAGIYKTADGQLKFYSKSEKSTITPCVSIDYENTFLEKGWNRQHIKMFGNCDPIEEFWGAGFLELYKNWKDFRDSFHNLRTALNRQINDWPFYWRAIDRIVDTVRQECNKPANPSSEKDVLKDMMVLFQAQLDGMLQGYNLAKGNDDEPITMANLYFMNFGGSVGEMYEVFEVERNFNMLQNMNIFLQEKVKVLRRGKRSTAQFYKEHHFDEVKKHGHCNVFAKFLKNADGKIDDFLLSHTTYDFYENTMKTMKSLDIKTKDHQWKLVFSSYPGVIYSGDDFYLTQNGLVITETSLGATNPSEYAKVQGINLTHPDFMRVFGATLLASNGAEWIDIMTKTTTGTYPSQWIILDLNKFKESRGLSELKPGTIYIAEQSTERVLSRDFSKEMSDGSTPFWASFNEPYFEEIRLDLDAASPLNSINFLDVQKSYQSDPKYKIFENYAPNINGLLELKNLMRMNRYETEDGVSAPDEIASRGDLGGYSSFFGATDVKALNYALASEGVISAQMGPTHSNVTSFKWPQDYYAQLKGLPSEYLYDWQEYNWEGK